MATTTPNFGWPVPTSTDLVKDGATAIEALGDAIDASLVDLEGGTTGQILAKASNTDMDFAWITNDVGDITAVTAGTGISGGGTSGAVTITNSMATEIAAKGDLIVGTGSQTFDNLTAGSDYGFLQALSSTSTGLQWGNALTSYTPTATSVGGTITSYTSTGAWIQIGKLVFFRASVNITDAGTGFASLNITLPKTASLTGIPVYGQEVSATGKGLTGNLTSTSVASVRFYDWTTSIATGNINNIFGIYEVA